MARKMLKIVFIHLVIVMTTYASEYKCETTYAAYPGLICGTDGKTYEDDGSFACAQNKEYGKRINLQLKHDGPCWPWQHYRHDIKKFFIKVNF